MRRLRSSLANPSSLAAALLALMVAWAPARPRQARTLPAELSDSTFWRLVTTMSEPGGYFPSDNFVSNETTYEWPIPRLVAATPRGGVYLGVGPEQNFTYIVALQPRMAFIVDIRRQAVLQHLLYKALFELCDTRREFLSRLFSRPLPGPGDPAAGPGALMRAVALAPASGALRDSTLRAVDRRLTVRHGFTLSDDDLRGIAYVLNSFYEIGPQITYSGDPSVGRRGRWMPSYSEMAQATDSAGVARGFLATEANYRWIRDLERRNMLVPVVGDFGGPKALRAVGRYVRDRGATITAFYTSNVEQYLFRETPGWRAFYANVGTLPITPRSVFIRAVFGGYGYGYGRGYGGMRSETMLAPIDTILAAFRAGRIQSYWDVVGLSR